MNVPNHTEFASFLVSKEVKKKMGSCQLCKKDSKMSCVCGNASYCGVECQKKDWKSHKPSCPPFVIRESPGKGRGLFATRKIKEGQVIIEEYPLLTLPSELNFVEFQSKYYPKYSTTIFSVP